eukprot:gnl/TRDRNA2_/TRDRNA2_140617_c1_seq1.p1 gnl/TRDRNA2_/TRDRNA2_140617_c1~~gnl/TRDRNA2_/TRDRNA2_140617_c1_seq1.p1  ORF type:complete len:355 (-),score=47.61 gnl/TRDRNA2_/TRDRNA2_140617_c1_seq1:228-1292(-)
MGDVLDELDNSSAALAALRTAVHLEPHQPDAWSALGAAQADNGALDDAQKALSKAVALLPDEPILRAPLCSVLRSSGRFEEAYKELQVLQEAQLVLDNDDSALRTSLAFAPCKLASGSASDIGDLAVTGEGDERVAPGGHVAAHLKRSALCEDFPPEWIERLSRIHLTRVATKAQCEWAIATAERHAAATGGWDAHHEDYYRTSFIIVADNQDLRAWVQVLLRDSIWPAIKLQFDIDPEDLWLEDCFLNKYEVSGQRGLDRHCDDSDFSFNLLLSDPASFEGGGTSFTRAEPEEVTLQPAQGEVITHYGLVEHEGKQLVRGASRYILVGFVRAKPLAKRWREFGKQWELMQSTI